MDKKDFIHYIQSLGFNHGSDNDSYFLINNNISIVIEEKLDYYTSYYGNHPKIHSISFIRENSHHNIVLTHNLKDITIDSLIHCTDTLFHLYRPSQNYMYVDIVFKYDKRKKNLLKVLNRDIKLETLLNDKTV